MSEGADKTDKGGPTEKADTDNSTWRSNSRRLDEL